MADAVYTRKQTKKAARLLSWRARYKQLRDLMIIPLHCIRESAGTARVAHMSTIHGRNRGV